MRDALSMLRTAGIVAGILFLLIGVWVVLIGPAILLALHPR